MHKKESKFVIIDRTTSPLKYLATGLTTVRLALLFTTDKTSARLFRTQELAEVYMKDLIQVSPRYKGKLQVCQLDKIGKVLYEAYERAMGGL